MSEMSGLHDTDEEIAALSAEGRGLRDKAISLREGNSKDIAFIESHLRGRFEVTDARVDFLFRQLMKLGVLTPEQFWKMNVDWELELQEQVWKAKAHVESELRKMAIAQGLPDPTAKPNKSGLIVPGQ